MVKIPNLENICTTWIQIKRHIKGSELTKEPVGSILQTIRNQNPESKIVNARE